MPKRKSSQRNNWHKSKRGAGNGNRSSARSSETASNVTVPDSEESNKFGSNSIEWYTRYPNLLLGAAQIPYPYKPGMFVPLGSMVRDITNNVSQRIDEPIPGILVLNWTPSVGTSTAPTSPISIIGKEIYARVREKFSGALEADAPDFVIYLMALDSIFSYIANLKRLYRVINAYSPDNYYTPDGLLYAMGFNDAQTQDLRSTKIQLFQSINELVLMTRKFKCPRIMDVFNRHVWMNDHIYTDAPTIKSQFFMFNQTQWYKFSMLPIISNPSVKAGGLQLVSPLRSLPQQGVVQHLVNFGRELINALAASDDGYLISGYLMRAYQDVPSFEVDELLLGEILIPKYNEEVLGEIENSHALPENPFILNDITQDPATNAIISTPTARVGDGWVNQRRMQDILPRFSSRMDSPTVADTVINSRLMSYLDGDPVKVDTHYHYAIVAATEILTSYSVVYPQDLTGAPYVSMQTSSEVNFVEFTSQPASAVNQFLTLMRIVQWDWCPSILVAAWLSGTEFEYSLLGDIHNITTVDMRTLKNINTVCLYSIFNAFT